MTSVVLATNNNLPAGLQFTAVGLVMPESLNVTQWRDVGSMLATMDNARQWALGDWWNAGIKWGDGESACEAVGVEYQTARDAGSICGTFELSRRRDKLTFTHHREVAPLKTTSERDRFLDWCEEPINGSGGKPRSTRELREAIRSYLDEQGWTKEEKARRQQVEQGTAIVANIRSDERLVQWAQFKGIAERIDRQSKWGNPFELPADGTRKEVCDHYEIYLKLKPSLLKDINALRGKVLLCWCHPERCHGHHLAELANDCR